MRPTTRRVFLGTAGALAVAPRPVWANGPAEKVRLAVIGLRGRGSDLCASFTRDPSSEVVAVCDVDDDAKVGFLKAMYPFASGRLTLHTADLDQPGCFDDVFRGCDGVAHVSHVSTYDDAEYVQRTCDHIIASVE